MSAPVILMPTTAAETVCHEEQMTIWVSEFVGMLSLGGYLRENLDYSEGVDLTNDVARELRSIIKAAFDHPEAKTIKRRP